MQTRDPDCGRRLVLQSRLLAVPHRRHALRQSHVSFAAWYMRSGTNAARAVVKPALCTPLVRTCSATCVDRHSTLNNRSSAAGLTIIRLLQVSTTEPQISMTYNQHGALALACALCMINLRSLLVITGSRQDKHNRTSAR